MSFTIACFFFYSHILAFHLITSISRVISFAVDYCISGSLRKSTFTEPGFRVLHSKYYPTFVNRLILVVFVFSSFFAIVAKSVGRFALTKFYLFA